MTKKTQTRETLSELRDFVVVEPRKRLAEILALVEHGSPRQARLKDFEDHELEQLSVVVQRHAPFGVVVADQEIVGRPWASMDHSR